MLTAQAKVEIKSPEALKVASRSQVYRLLSLGFRLPTEESLQFIRNGSLSQELREAAQGLPYSFSISSSLGQGLTLDAKGLETIYINQFEVGGEYGPPCSLYEGSYGQIRTRLMAELLSFYHLFGLRLVQEKGRELPDHLVLELEFMHYLTFNEARLREEGKERKAYIAGERDFLKWHLVDFTSAIAKKMALTQLPFYSELVKLAASFCQAELDFLVKSTVL